MLLMLRIHVFPNLIILLIIFGITSRQVLNLGTFLEGGGIKYSKILNSSQNGRGNKLMHFGYLCISIIKGAIRGSPEISSCDKKLEGMST